MILALALGACRVGSNDDARQTSTTAAAASSAPVANALEVVDDRSKVCMVNDQFMGKPQIPTDVAGKRYYGCCAMCKEKLEKNESARSATDPVSGARVDKATAVIGRDANGKVYYFESEASLRRFRTSS